jgi:hypothetical protein
MKRICLVSLVGILLSGSALADVTYTFSASPSPVQSFSFSFQTPNFLGPGDPFTFTPFTIIDGNSVPWTISSGASTYISSNGGCFLFGSGDQTLPNGQDTNCELGIPSAGADMWFYQGGSQSSTFPTTDGTFSGYYVVVFYPGGPGTDNSGTIAVTGVAVPEPTSTLLCAILLFTTLLFVAFVKNRRSILRW